MVEADVLDKLSSVFRTVFQDQTLVARPEMSADDVERWDSLSHVDMIVLVEETFGIRLSTREVTSMKNVGDLVRTILAKVSRH